jgi:tRNA threonylcarbamoyladenosine biosynthesis protein TsaB
VRLLAIETATAVTAIALSDGADVREVIADGTRRHTEALAPAIAAALRETGLAARDLDGIVVDVGPGLFTGLRVGIATAKGLAVATGVGLHAVTSTDALAAAARDAGIRGAVVAIVDARRGELFVARYAVGDVEPVLIGGPQVVAPSGLPGIVAELGGTAARGEAVTAVGDGAVRAADALGAAGAVVRDDVDVPSPASAIRLVQDRIEHGELALRHVDVHPVYLREADAVANFQVRGERA